MDSERLIQNLFPTHLPEAPDPPRTCDRRKAPSPRKNWRPKLQPNLWLLICCVTLRSLLFSSFRVLDLQNMAWVPGSLLCLLIANLELQCSYQTPLLPVAAPTGRRLVSHAYRGLATLDSGWLREKSEGLESDLPLDFPTGLAKKPAGTSKVEFMFVLPDANNGRKSGFYDSPFLRRLRKYYQSWKSRIILKNRLSDVTKTTSLDDKSQ